MFFIFLEPEIENDTSFLVLQLLWDCSFTLVPLSLVSGNTVNVDMQFLCLAPCDMPAMLLVLVGRGDRNINY